MVNDYKGVSRGIMLIISISIIMSLADVSLMCKFYATLSSIVIITQIFSRSARPFTIHKVVNIFLLIFFVFANLVQCSYKEVVSSIPAHFSNEEYEWFQFLTLCISLLYNMLYKYYEGKHIPQSDWNTSTSISLRPSRLLLFSFIGLVGTVFYFRSQPALLFVRALEDGTDFGYLTTNMFEALIFDKTLRCFPVACLIIALLNKQYSKKIIVPLFIMMLFAVFPTSMARNAAAMYWIPIALLLFGFFRKQQVFSWFLLAAFFLIFPFLDIFRYFRGNVNYEFKFNLDYLNTMNFDSSQEFMIIMQSHIITYGKQLLGPILFFVPRSVWPDKPIGSGAFVAEQHKVFGNISMPWWGEGYINFGIIGVIVFTLILAYITCRLDKWYWSNVEQGNNARFTDGLYLLIVAGTTFLLRGDLLSSFSYTVGTLFSYWVIMKMCTNKK